MTPAPNRRWFRFSLWTLFVAMTLTAIVTYKVTSDYRLQQERAEFFPNFNDHQFSLRGVGLVPPDYREISWFRKLILGDSPCLSLMYSPEIDPGGKQLEHVRRLFPEARIWGWTDKNLPEGIKPIDPARHIII